MPNLKEMSGYSADQFSKGVELTDVYSILPSDTYPTHATMYTGDAAGNHGMTSMGGFVDREKLEYREVASFKELVWEFKLTGPLDQYLNDMGYSQNTFLSRLERSGYKTMVAGNMYKLGTSNYLRPTGEYWQYCVEPYACALDSAVGTAMDVQDTDQSNFEHAILSLSGSRHDDLITIYTWNTDHGAHKEGLDFQVTYAPMIDAWIKQLEDFLKAKKIYRNAVFIVFDDHGRIDISSDPSNFVSPAYPAISELLTPYIWEGDIFNYIYQLGESTVAFGFDGTMLQLMFRPNLGTSSWAEHPTYDSLKAVLKTILSAKDITPNWANPFKGELKWVLYTDHSNAECPDNYCGVDWDWDGDTVQLYSLENYFGNSVDADHIQVIKQQLKQLRGPKSHNSGEIILILRDEGNTPGFDGGEYGYIWKINDLPVSFDDNLTMHGSVSKYESNPLFLMFYPSAPTGYEWLFKTRILEFLGEYQSAETYGGASFRLTTSHPNTFVHAVIDSHKLYMPSQPTP